MKIILMGCGAVSEILYGPILKGMLAKKLVDEVVAIDRSPERVQFLRELVGKATIVGSLHELGTFNETTIVVVALPHHLHEPVAVQALEMGAHVLCEKPMARSTKECDRMLAAAERTGRLLAVGHFRRFYPVVQLIKKMIDDRFLGALKSFRFLEGEIYSWPASSKSFFDREAAGGGVLIDAGAHTLDLLLWWFGSVADFEYEDDAAGGVEANCVLRIKTDTGVKGYVQLSRDWPLANKYFFDFEMGWIVYTCDVVDTFHWGFHGSREVMACKMGGGRTTGFDQLPFTNGALPGFFESFEAQIVNLINAIEGKGQLLVTGSEGRKAVDLIERCYLQRSPLAAGWLPSEEQESMKTLVKEMR